MQSPRTYNFMSSSADKICGGNGTDDSEENWQPWFTFLFLSRKKPEPVALMEACVVRLKRFKFTPRKARRNGVWVPTVLKLPTWWIAPPGHPSDTRAIYRCRCNRANFRKNPRDWMRLRAERLKRFPTGASAVTSWFILSRCQQHANENGGEFSSGRYLEEVSPDLSLCRRN